MDVRAAQHPPSEHGPTGPQRRSRPARYRLRAVLAIARMEGAAIGSLLATALVFSVCVTVAGSTASDRYGRKAFLLVYDGLHALACLIAALSTSTALLAGCAIVTGFGRGANGTAGPFAAVERA